MAAYQSSQPPNEAVFRAILDWGQEKATQIQEGCRSKGGWEGWVQEEMRFLFNAAREDNCYQNSGRMAADLLLTPQSAGEETFEFPYVDEECVVIELKCESYMNALNFKDEVEKDIKKVRDGTFKDRLLRGGCNVYCIAFATSNQGGCDMEDLGMELFELDELTAPFQLWWSVRTIGSDEFYESQDDEPEFAFDEEDSEMQADEAPGFYDYEDSSIPGGHSNGWCDPRYGAY